MPLLLGCGCTSQGTGHKRLIVNPFTQNVYPKLSPHCSTAKRIVVAMKDSALKNINYVKNYDTEEISGGIFVISLKITDQYQWKDPGLTA